MMATPKAVSPSSSSSHLPGSLGIHLPAFKRKRIEQWCEEVAQYLRAGSLCRSVIGHSPGEGSSRLSGPAAVKSALVGGSHHHRTAGLHISAITATATSAAAAATSSNPNNNNNNAGGAVITTTSMGTMTDMLSFNSNKNNNNNNNAGFASNGGAGGVTKVDSAPPPGRGTPMPDTSGPLPVVKFSYNEQRRRVDRLVQGLPVLAFAANSPNPSGLNRTVGGGGNNNGGGAVTLVSGDEPVKAVGPKGDRAGRTAGRASPAPGSGPAQPARSNSRSSSGEPRHQRSLPPQLSRHHSVSSIPGHRNHHHHHHNQPSTPNSQPHGGGKGHSAGGKTQSSEIVVIEDGLPGEQNHRRQGEGLMVGSGLRSVRLNGLKRAQSLKVQKARQRMLAGTRRSGVEQNTHTHVPVQSCWTLAELTW